MASVKAYALNEVQIPHPDKKKVDGQPTPIQVIPAESVFDVDSDRFDELEELRAVRVATQQEVDIHDANMKRRGNAADRPTIVKSETVETPAQTGDGTTDTKPKSTPKAAKTDGL